MSYTHEQAKVDRQYMLIRASQLEANGEHQKAGILRAEAENCLSRVGMTKAHLVNLGPHTQSNPAICLDCGLAMENWTEGDICIPTSAHSPFH